METLVCLVGNMVFWLQFFTHKFLLLLNIFISNYLFGSSTETCCCCCCSELPACRLGGLFPILSKGSRSLGTSGSRMRSATCSCFQGLWLQINSSGTPSVVFLDLLGWKSWHGEIKSLPPCKETSEAKLGARFFCSNFWYFAFESQRSWVECFFK